MNRPHRQISFSSIFFDATEKKQNGQLSPRRTIRMREWLALIESMMSQAAQVDALMAEVGLAEPQSLWDLLPWKVGCKAMVIVPFRLTEIASVPGQCHDHLESRQRKL